jgi:predicted acetyltransferase
MKIETTPVAEFYIAPQHRRRGAGKSVAQQLFGRFGPLWEICCQSGDLPAPRFWTRVIDDYTGDEFRCLEDGCNS